MASRTMSVFLFFFGGTGAGVCGGGVGWPGTIGTGWDVIALLRGRSGADLRNTGYCWKTLEDCKVPV